LRVDHVAAFGRVFRAARLDFVGEWDEEWLYAERLYFASRPPDSFDLVVPGTT